MSKWNVAYTLYVFIQLMSKTERQRVEEVEWKPNEYTVSLNYGNG